jgi:hypothetical protein
LDRCGLITAFVDETNEHLTGIVAPFFYVITEARAIRLHFERRSRGKRIGLDGRFQHRLRAFHSSAIKYFRHGNPPFRVYSFRSIGTFRFSKICNGELVTLRQAQGDSLWLRLTSDKLRLTAFVTASREFILSMPKETVSDLFNYDIPIIISQDRFKNFVLIIFKPNFQRHLTGKRVRCA